VISKCSSQSTSCMSLTLSEKLEMIKFSEEGMTKLRQTESQVTNAKEKLLEEIKSTTAVNTQINKALLLIWRKFECSQNIPLHVTLIQRLREGRSCSLLQKKKCLKLTVRLVKFKKRSHLRNIKVQSEAASAYVEAAANFPEDTARQLMKAAAIFKADETVLKRKKMSSRIFLARKKSIPSFVISKDRLTLSGAKTAADFKLKPMLIYHFKYHRTLKNYAKSTLSKLYTWKLSPHLFTAWFTEYVKPTVETYYLILLLIDNASGHPRALREIYAEINVIFIPVNIAHMDKGVILTFKYYDLRNTFHIWAQWLRSGVQDQTYQHELKNIWKGFTIVDIIENICDMGGGKISTVTHVWKKLIPTLLDDLEGFKTLVEEVTAKQKTTKKNLELEVEPEDWTELLTHGKTVMDEEFLMDDLIKWFLKMKSTPGKCCKHCEMTTKDLEYVINLVYRAVSGFERIDSNFERSSSVDQMLLNSIVRYREILVKERVDRCDKLYLSYFKKFPQPQQALATNTLQPPSTSRQDPPLAKRLPLVESSN
uniref:DDE-1 domain-containing protein n=1 Tax=Chlorocebus sabaeus TaxID=60711 RepID=A0A0D9RXD0_CHLSB